MNTIAFDIASEVTTVAALSTNGKLTFEGKVETTGQALREAVSRVKRPRCVVFEECTQAAWLWSILEPISDDIIVCDPGKLHNRGQKTDVIDAQMLARKARQGMLSRVWHGGKQLQDLRCAVALYDKLTSASTRLKNQIRALFRARCLLARSEAYAPETRIKALAHLPAGPSRTAGQRLGTILDAVTPQRAYALRDMIRLARRQRRYSVLRTIDGIGPIFASMLLAIIGDPHRFRTRRQLYTYAGLAIRVFESGEYEVSRGKITRKKRKLRTRGLVREYNRALKYVFKQAVTTLSRTKWRPHYERILAHSKNEQNARLTLARKLAAIVLRVMKTGEPYDLTKAFPMQ